MELKAIETAVVQCGESTSVETLLQAGDMVARLGEFARDIKAQWEAKMVDHIQRSGPVVHGDWIYTVKTPPVTKCVDVPGAVEALLVTCQGDFGTFCEHLSSNALKHGAARKTLPQDVFDRLFVTTRAPELDRAEATPRRLQKINTKFIEQR